MANKRFFKKFSSVLAVICAAAMAIPNVVTADNPLVQTLYTADPAPMV